MGLFSLTLSVVGYIGAVLQLDLEVTAHEAGFRSVDDGQGQCAWRVPLEADWENE